MVSTLWLAILLGIAAITAEAAEAWKKCKTAQCQVADPKVPSGWPGLAWYQFNCAYSCYVNEWPAALCENVGPCCEKVALANKNGANIITNLDIAFFCGHNPCDDKTYYNTTTHWCEKLPLCSKAKSNTPGKRSFQCVPDPKDKKPASQYTVSSKGADCMKGFEGFCRTCYVDTKCKWTIGFGFKKNSKAECAKVEPMTLEHAHAIYDQEIVKFENAVKKLVKVDITQGQFDALVDMAYNMGPTKFAQKSKVLAFVNKQQFSQAVQALRDVTGEEAPRRKIDADMFESNYSTCKSYEHTKCPTVCQNKGIVIRHQDCATLNIGHVSSMGCSPCSPRELSVL